MSEHLTCIYITTIHLLSSFNPLQKEVLQSYRLKILRLPLMATLSRCMNFVF